MTRERIVLAVFLLSVSLALAQRWDIEQVDSGRVGGDLQIRQGGGATYLGYVGPEGQIRLAHKDSIWEYDDLDTTLVVPDFSLAVSPDGEPAVAGMDTGYRPLLVQHTDTGWTTIWSHERLQHLDPLARVAFTPAGEPVVAYCVNLLTSGGIVVETRVDTTWEPDTAAAYIPSPPNQCQITLYDLDCDSSGNPLILYRYAEGFPGPGMPPWSYAVVRGHRSGGLWTLMTLGGGNVWGYDITASLDETPCAVYYVGGYLRCEQDTIWPADVFDAAVRVDSQERRHVVFVNPDGTLHYAYKDAGWHFRTVPGVTGATSCDMVLSEDNQPEIAYATAEGVFIAWGVDVTAVEDEWEPSNGSAPQSVIRGVLFMPVSGARRGECAALLDAAGRRVLALKTGANDVSRLSPGVYFVREPQARTQTLVVSKVLIVR